MRLFAVWRAAPVIVAIIVLFAAGSLAGCAPESAPGGAAAPLSIESAFARPAPAGGNGGAFITVVNAGSSADRLIAARSAVAPNIELHETVDDNGVMKMRPVPAGFEVPAKGRLELKPGGKHLMFLGLTSPLVDGKEVEITLVFEKAGEITVKAPIRL
jgi:copper(I)-binding protein